MQNILSVIVEKESDFLRKHWYENFMVKWNRIVQGNLLYQNALSLLLWYNINLFQMYTSFCLSWEKRTQWLNVNKVKQYYWLNRTYLQSTKQNSDTKIYLLAPTFSDR